MNGQTARSGSPMEGLLTLQLGLKESHVFLGSASVASGAGNAVSRPTHQAREWRSAAPHFDRRFAASFRRDLVRLRAAP